MVPQGTNFVDADSKCITGHAYASENATVDETTWTTMNTFTWVARGESQSLLKGFAHRSSEPCSENDRVELHPKDGATQRLMLGLTGKAVWHRASRNKAGLREENIEPQDRTITADLVISTWPK